MWNFPWFFAGKLKHWWNTHTVNDHSSDDKRKIKFFSVMGTNCLVRAGPFGKHITEIAEDLFFVLVAERLQGHSFFFAGTCDQSAGNAHDFSELRIDSSPWIHCFRV